MNSSTQRNREQIKEIWQVWVHDRATKSSDGSPLAEAKTKVKHYAKKQTGWC